MAKTSLIDFASRFSISSSSQIDSISGSAEIIVAVGCKSIRSSLEPTGGMPIEFDVKRGVSQPGVRPRVAALQRIGLTVESILNRRAERVLNRDSMNSGGRRWHVRTHH